MTVPESLTLSSGFTFAAKVDENTCTRGALGLSTDTKTTAWLDLLRVASEIVNVTCEVVFGEKSPASNIRSHGDAALMEGETPHVLLKVGLV